MGFKFSCAKLVAGVSSFGLKKVLKRQGGNFPGKIALYADPELLNHLSSRLSEGSILVVGTNGKTTTTLMVADVLERSGRTVICNKTGANLDSGVATVLLEGKKADWGVFEVDELWLARILPQMQSRYVVLLDLFPDQEDRTGGVDVIQRSIVGALQQSPHTTLVFNADDPHCSAIAAQVGNPRIALGLDESMGLALIQENAAQACDVCGAEMSYAIRQYDQLGSFSCPSCGFARPELDVRISDVELREDSLSFTLVGLRGPALLKQLRGAWTLEAPYSAAYMVYNLGFVALMALLTGCDAQVVSSCFEGFNPQNGRLLTLELDGRDTLINLAKNPAGFDQNLRIVAQSLQKGRGSIVAFFVNNREGDGRDPSWLDAVSFEALAAAAAQEGSGKLRVFAGGMCTAELTERLARAGLDAQAAQTTEEVLAVIADEPKTSALFLIANYTALPPVRDAALRLATKSE